MDDNTSISPPRLACVASYLNSAEAELSRIRLAMDGIPGWLENDTLITWCWPYSNAVGGVKLFVPGDFQQQASEILLPAVRLSDAASWQCLKCRAEVFQDWTCCWSCGTSREGIEDDLFFTDPASTSDASYAILTSTACGVLLICVALLIVSLSAHCIFTLMYPIVLLIAIIAHGWCFTPEIISSGSVRIELPHSPGVCRESQEPLDGPDGDYLAEQSYEILRLWQASVLSLFFFPPLAIYVFYTLLRFNYSADTALPRDRRHYWGAWAAVLCAVPIGSLMIFAILAWMVTSAFWCWDLLGSLFNAFWESVGIV